MTEKTQPKIKDWLKKPIIKIYNKIDKETARIKAKKLYPDYDKYIFKLFFENYPIAMSLSSLKRLDDLCKEIKPKLVIEFGSGVSTAVLAKNSQDNDCKIITVDESFKYLEKTYKNIAKKYKTDNMTFIYAPNGYQSLAENIAINQKVDLVVIDGPFSERYIESVREFYHKIISPQTVCVIDNTYREKDAKEAENIARLNSLKRMDFKDPLYEGYQYSILFPYDQQKPKK